MTRKEHIKYILITITLLFIFAYVIHANRTEFVGLQIELDDTRIHNLRKRANDLNPITFKTEEIVIIYNGERKAMRSF
jgi:hypothetical protein